MFTLRKQIDSVPPSDSSSIQVIRGNAVDFSTPATYIASANSRSTIANNHLTTLKCSIHKAPNQHLNFEISPNHISSFETFSEIALPRGLSFSVSDYRRSISNSSNYLKYHDWLPKSTSAIEPLDLATNICGSKEFRQSLTKVHSFNRSSTEELLRDTSIDETGAHLTPQPATLHPLATFGTSSHRKSFILGSIEKTPQRFRSTSKPDSLDQRSRCHILYISFI